MKSRTETVASKSHEEAQKQTHPIILIPRMREKDPSTGIRGRGSLGAFAPPGLSDFRSEFNFCALLRLFAAKIPEASVA
jgi:hypothetical protein